MMIPEAFALPLMGPTTQELLESLPCLRLDSKCALHNFVQGPLQVVDYPVLSTQVSSATTRSLYNGNVSQ